MKIRQIRRELVEAAGHVTTAQGLLRVLEAELPSRGNEDSEAFGGRDLPTQLLAAIQQVGRKHLQSAHESLLAAMSLTPEELLRGE